MTTGQAPGHARALPVTIIGWLFIVVGCGGIVRAVWPFVAALAAGSVTALDAHERVNAAWVGGLGVVALLGGAWLLRGVRWGRWLLAAWMGFHVVLSFFHSASELVVHCVLFSAIAYFLFRRKRSSRASAGPRREL